MSKKSPMIVIFTTVFLDLVGFGIVIPLVAVYGRRFGADAVHLGMLGAVYSVMQFFFAPFWGNLSDRIGRRPVLLISLLGSTCAYFGFAMADSYWALFATRALAGIFAANISAAQAYIADITTPESRAKGMGMIGAAFGIGFTLGPPLGGISAAEFGLAAPGLIAGTICALNLLLAVFRLPESLSKELRDQVKMGGGARRSRSPLDLRRLREVMKRPELGKYLATSFLVTFAFSNIEQVFAVFIQDRFSLETAMAGYRTGILLMWAGILGALIQGGLIRRLAPKFGERRLLWWGLLFGVVAMAFFPYGPTWGSYFALIIPLAIANGLINPSLYSLVSRAAAQTEQGAVMGVSQGLSSLARAFGPMVGMVMFGVGAHLPFNIAAGCYLAAALWHWKSRGVARTETA